MSPRSASRSRAAERRGAPERLVRPPDRLALASCMLSLIVTGCAARPFHPPPSDPILHPGPARAADSAEGLIPRSRRSRLEMKRHGLVSSAAAMVGAGVPSVAGRSFRADCSGFVQAVYAQSGVDLYAVPGTSGLNGVAVIQRYVARHGHLHGRRPSPGDIIFFDGTHGPPGRRLTHAGVVERLEPDGTVVFLHHMQGRIIRSRLNRRVPSSHQDPESGKVLNDYLRRGSSGPRLAGELFAGYGTVFR